MNKYRNIKTEVDGITFDSRKEMNRYFELSLLVRTGEIGELRLQPNFEIIINNKKVCSYRADFTYFDKIKSKHVVEDVKSEATRKLPVYRLKKKLMQVVNGIEIVEI